MIVDFDKRYNGNVAEQFNSNRNVLYVSLNHCDTQAALSNNSETVIWSDEGLNVNISMNKVNRPCESERKLGFQFNVFFFNQETVNDFDYVAAVQRIVLPIAYEFNPELVLVSADFDEIRSANVSSEIFGYLIRWLSALANGKIIVFAKGDCSAIALSIKALLGDPLPMLKSTANISNIETIQNVMTVQQKYWKSLKFDKMLPM